MVLTYRFKKEKLDSGKYAIRPRIFVSLTGPLCSIDVPALIDSGCDVTAIPEGIAKSLGIDMSGEKDQLFGFRESSDAVLSTVSITFEGKQERQSEQLNKIPVLVVCAKPGEEEETEIVLGIDSIFDYFDITFKKSQNRIITKS